MNKINREQMAKTLERIYRVSPAIKRDGTEVIPDKTLDGFPYIALICPCGRRHNRSNLSNFQCGCNRKYIWGERTGKELFPRQ